MKENCFEVVKLKYLEHNCCLSNVNRHEHSELVIYLNKYIIAILLTILSTKGSYYGETWNIWQVIQLTYLILSLNSFEITLRQNGFYGKIILDMYIYIQKNGGYGDEKRIKVCKHIAYAPNGIFHAVAH